MPPPPPPKKPKPKPKPLSANAKHDQLKAGVRRILKTETDPVMAAMLREALSGSYSQLRQAVSEFKQSRRP